ncbi:MAG: ribulose-phosphate 3-epimerase [Acidobacteria bacterium]|nr:ribulose-phosphate 3-epimerase [Acidobacteriota bacterium]
MSKELLIAPSILSADFANLTASLEKISEADLLHVDVMDGRFVPNITYGPLIVKTLKKISDKPLDVHLMIVEPEKYIDAFIDAGADWLSIHQEASIHLQRSLTRIKERGAKAGVVLNPATALETIEYAIEYLDYILLMSVNPGFGGQKFIPNSLRKIEALVKMTERLKPEVIIEIDGGVTLDNIDIVYNAGATMIVSGSGIFKTENPNTTISAMREKCRT